MGRTSTDQASRISSSSGDALSRDPDRASKVNAPTIEKSPIQVECRVFTSVVARPARKVFLAEVLATSVHE